VSYVEGTGQPMLADKMVSNKLCNFSVHLSATSSFGNLLLPQRLSDWISIEFGVPARDVGLKSRLRHCR
jgi:hypothetical protein